jgi:hypothetical protein
MQQHAHNDNLTEWHAGNGLGSNMQHAEANVKLPLSWSVGP